MNIEIEPRKWKNQIKSKLNEYKRVLQIANKPDREEFSMAAKITGAGILFIGFIGFLFYMTSNLIPQMI